MVLPSFKGYEERSDVKIIKKIRTVNAHFLLKQMSVRGGNKFPPDRRGAIPGGWLWMDQKGLSNLTYQTQSENGNGHFCQKGMVNLMKETSTKEPAWTQGQGTMQKLWACPGKTGGDIRLAETNYFPLKNSEALC
jgi:hypothetical protein